MGMCQLGTRTCAVCPGMDLQVEGMLETSWAAQGCPRPLRDAQGFSGLLRNVQGCSRLLRDAWGMFRDA